MSESLSLNEKSNLSLSLVLAMLSLVVKTYPFVKREPRTPAGTPESPK